MFAKRCVYAEEIMRLIPNQENPYDPKQVAEAFRQYICCYPNIRELNLRNLVLKIENVAARQLMPELFKTLPNLQSLVVPRAIAGLQFDYDTSYSFSVPMETMLQNLPPKLEKLDLCQAMKNNELTNYLCSLKVRLNHLTHLRDNGRFALTKQDFLCFPAIRHRRLKPDRTTRKLSTFLSTEKICSAPTSFESLCLENPHAQLVPLGSFPTSSAVVYKPIPTLKKIELVRFIIDKETQTFLKENYPPPVQITYTHCAYE
ncbi:MAG: hypothetical protein ACHQT8_04055 [Chlamydiales bacterium]